GHRRCRRHRLRRAGGAAHLAAAGGGETVAAASGQRARRRLRGACRRRGRTADRARPRPEARRADGHRRRAVLPVAGVPRPAEADMTLLCASGLNVSLGAKPVLRGLDLSVAAGEFVGLIGPNGAGKSTLLRAVLGLLPFTGSILLDGDDTAAMKARRRALKVAYLAQEREIAWA